MCCGFIENVLYCSSKVTLYSKFVSFLCFSRSHIVSNSVGEDMAGKRVYHCYRAKEMGAIK